MALRKRDRDGYTEVGNLLAQAADLKGWTMAKIAGLACIPPVRLHRIACGARLSYADGLRLEDVLGLARGTLDLAYREWARRR